MFALALLYYLLTYYYRMNIMNVSYEITPPSVEDMNYTSEYIQELRMQAAIERFASFDEYMEIPGFGDNRENGDNDISDDCTILYDDEEYGFDKCGEIAGCYDYSEFNEAETILPDYDDYQLPEEEDDNTCPMDIENGNNYDYGYHNDPEYWQEMLIERMMDMV